MNIERRAPKKAPRLVRLARIASTSRGRELLRGAKARKEFERKVGLAVMNQMGGGMPNMSKIRELPRTRADFEKMREEMADHYKTVATAYTFLAHGEPLHNVSDRFIRSMGMTPDQITRPEGYIPPQNILYRRLRPEAIAAEVNALRERIETDEFIDPELKRNILGNLRIMKQKGTVRDHWDNIRIVAGNVQQILEGITDPEVRVTAEEARKYLPGVKESLVAYDRLAERLPRSGRFAPEDVARMYATFHGDSRKNTMQHVQTEARG